MGSETTAAATGTVGEVRRDPFAMLPFCGYHIGDYFKHWLAMGEAVANPPRIFRVNWFRKDANGKFVWPGFGENMRVLQWIVERCRGRAHAVESAVGCMPAYDDVNWTAAPFDAGRFGDVMRLDREEWKKELAEHDALFARIGTKLPAALRASASAWRRVCAGKTRLQEGERGRPRAGPFFIDLCPMTRYARRRCRIISFLGE